VNHSTPPLEYDYIRLVSGDVTAIFRDECLNTHWFLSLLNAQEKIERWRQGYNSFRPHSSLQNLTPDEVMAVALTVELHNA
jgi:putative transposase